jgi:hypothetical protein
MDLLWSIVTVLVLGLGFGGCVTFAVLFTLWYAEKKNER